MNKSRVDVYTKIVLTAIAILLGALALRPAISPVRVQAQSDLPCLYVEPGVTSIRLPDGSSLGDGKIMIDLRNGDVWGFPTNMAGARYPVDVTASKPATSKPAYLGKFDLTTIGSRR